VAFLDFDWLPRQTREQYPDRHLGAEVLRITGHLLKDRTGHPSTYGLASNHRDA
jgi:hypothetical protein